MNSEFYFKDVFQELLNTLIELNANFSNCSEENKEFQAGLILGYYQTLSHMINQAEGFQFSLSEYGWEDLDLEKYLVSSIK